MMITEYWTYILVRTKKQGKMITLTGRVTNPDHPRLGDWRYGNATPGKALRSGVISERELRRNWEALLCNHNTSPDVCDTCAVCPLCINAPCSCSEGSES